MCINFVHATNVANHYATLVLLLTYTLLLILCWCRYGRDHPVKHIKLQRDADGSFYIADCKMFRNIVVSYLCLQKRGR